MSGPTDPERNSVFVLTMTADDGAGAEVLQRYWAADTDEHGRPKFRETVAQIAVDLDVPSAEVTRSARAAGYATRSGVTCPGCDSLWQFRTRSDRVPAGSYSRCERCAEARAAASRAEREAAEVAMSSKRDCVARSLSRGDIDAEPHAALGSDCAKDRPFVQLVNLWTWLRATGPSGVLQPPRDHDTPLVAQPGEEGAFASELFQGCGLRIDPSTSVDAFVWTDDDVSELPDRFYPSESSFHLPGSGPLRGRVEDAICQIAAALDQPWPLRWAEDAVELSRSVLVGEACRYLDDAVASHGLPPTTGEIRDDLHSVARAAVQTYTLGQCYSLLWRAAKDGAAATKRHPMPLASGTSHAVNQFRANLSRARSGKWKVYQYNEIATLPLAWQTRTLFGHVLKIDAMHASVDVVQSAVRERLSDDDTIRRQLAEGIPHDRAAAACDAILTHVPAEWSDNALDVLAGVRATLRSVVDAGASPGDAVRTAYFALQFARTLDVAPPSEIQYCERMILNAVAGVTDLGGRTA